MALGAWQATIVDQRGNIRPGVLVTVREETVGSPLASIYSDRDGNTPLSNPFTADSDGFARFYAANATYRIEAGSGLMVWRDVLVSDGIGTGGGGSTTYVRPNFGAVSQDVAEAALRLFTPEQFGAAGDGTTDDSAAFRNALNALIDEGGGALLIGDKTYRIADDIAQDVIAGVESVAIIGQGPRSILDFSDDATAGIYLQSSSTAVNQRPRFWFQNFRIITSKQNCGTALQVSYADGDYAHDSVNVFGVEIAQNVSRLSDSGSDYGYWGAGIVINNARNASLSKWSFSGELNLSPGSAYAFRALGDSIGIRLDDFRILECTTAISVEGTCEGLYLSTYEIVQVRFGVRWNVTSGAEPLLSSVNGHIVAANNGIYCTNVVFGHIVATNMYAAASLDTGTWPTWYGVLVDGPNSQQWTIGHSTFSKEAGRTGDTTVAIQISTGKAYSVGPNKFLGLSGNPLTFGIILASGVDKAWIGGNQYTDVIVPRTLTGATNVDVQDTNADVLAYILAQANTWAQKQTLADVEIGSANLLQWSNELILGRRGAANLSMGAADGASPVSQYLSVQNVAAGNANVAGASRYIDGSQGTGMGAGGSIVLRVAPAGSSGSAQNALANALSVAPGLITAHLPFTFSGNIIGTGSIRLQSDRFVVGFAVNGAVVANDAVLGFNSAGTGTGSPDAAFRAPSGYAGTLQFAGNATGTAGAAMEFIERSAPSAPVADRVRIYAQDNGAGKTQLMALFPTGAAQQIAIEP